MKGLYPKVLEELLIRRNSLKRRLAPLNDRKEELEKEISLAEARARMLQMLLNLNTLQLPSMSPV